MTILVTFPPSERAWAPDAMSALVSDAPRSGDLQATPWPLVARIALIVAAASVAWLPVIAIAAHVLR